MLWSDLENLYEKFGFCRVGGFVETGKRNFEPSDSPAGFARSTFSELSHSDFDNLKHLYGQFNEKFFFTIKREEKDWSIIKEMNSIDLYYKKNATQKIEKYFCVNKGRDLSHIIHEVSAENLVEFNDVIKSLQSFKVWLPENFASQFPHSDIFYNAFVRLGSLSPLKDFLLKISKAELLVEKFKEDKVCFLFQNVAYEVTQKDFLLYLFGPKPLEEFEQFNLSFYISGVDSI